MNVSSLVLALVLAASVCTAHAQGFAGLGAEAGDFETVEPGRAFAFPEDHGPHPGFRIEWWYVTSNLRDADGNDYGIQWTLFRQALAPGGSAAGGRGWANGQLWMGHAGLTTADRHFSAEKFARGGIGQAGVSIAPFEAFIDDWRMAATGGDGAIEALSLAAGTAEFGYDLRLDADRAPVLNGEAGYSVKSEAGQASYYYSQPFYEVEGTLDIGGERVAVTGKAWMDREWSSQPLTGDQEGWDWFALHLPDGAKAMLYRLREGTGESYLPGTFVAADGTVTALQPGEIELEPLATTRVAGRDVPTRWAIRIPGRGVDIETEPLNPQSWMDTAFSYWEGPIRFSGSHEGIGYLEMTGYGADRASPHVASGGEGR